MATALTTVYCTTAELQRKASADAVREYADHDRDGLADDSVIDDSIQQATDEINALAGQRYSVASLATSVLVNRWCVMLAWYFLCINRGNPVPDSVAEEFKRIMEKLTLVATGKMQLPNLPLRTGFGMTFANVIVNRNYVQSKVRVQEQISTDQTTVLERHEQLDVPTPNL